MRLTMLRQVSGLSARVIHCASAARRSLSGCSAASLNSKFSFSKSRAGAYVFARLEDAAAMQHLDGARLAAGGQIALRFKP